MCATGVRIVNKDHNITPHPKTRLPPNLSAKYPPSVIVINNRCKKMKKLSLLGIHSNQIAPA